MKQIFLLHLTFVFCAGIYAQTDALPADEINRRINDSIAFHQSLMEETYQQTAGVNNSLNCSLTMTATMDYSGCFTLGGNANTYYPVAFTDGGWPHHETTILHLGHSNAHENGSWHGSLIASIRFHTYRWGHGSNFGDADIKQYDSYGLKIFIAGWEDATRGNASYTFVIWLRGATTYYWHSNYSQNPVFTNSTLTVDTNIYQPKTEVENYVNSYGPTFSGNLSVSGKIGIGTGNPTHKLDVRGTIRANEVLVNSGGADFVFKNDYRLPSLNEVEQFITTHKHLPGIAPADSMVQNGVNMGELQIQLLQKIEELTLYVIELQKEINILKNRKEE